MRELLYTVLELEEWNKEVECSFCPGLNKAVCQIRTRSKKTDKIIANDEACQDCKEKFENDELSKCKDCGRLQIDSDIDIYTGKYVCRCIRRKENLEEKELPVLPHDRRPNGFYERQINGLQEEKTELEEEIGTHLEALEVSEKWSEEKIKRIKELEAEVERLRKLTPQALVDEIESYKKEIEQLKAQLTQLQQQNGQLATQIEIPSKDKGIRNFFKFGSK